MSGSDLQLREERVALERLDESFEGIGSIRASEAAGNLSLDLNHADVALGLIVGEWYRDVPGEAQDLVAQVLEARRQIECDRASSQSALAGCGLSRKASGIHRTKAAWNSPNCPSLDAPSSPRSQLAKSCVLSLKRDATVQDVVETSFKKRNSVQQFLHGR